MTTTMDRTEPAPAPHRYWKAPRFPVLVAIAVVAVVTAALWGLHGWGPINPAVEVGWSSASGNWSTITLDITNQSQSSMTVESVTITRLGQTEGVTTTVPDIEIGPQSTQPITVDLPPCTLGTSPTLSVELGVRNELGWPVTLLDTVQVNSCPVEMGTPAWPPATVALPAPGVQPIDVPAARTGVTQAFWTVYDGSRTAADRGAMIDDPAGIDAAYAQAQRPVDDETLTMARADVRAIVFDTPEHAWVDYGVSFGLDPGSSQVGEAVLVDGTWKVARATVCRDLRMLNVTCPR